MSHFDVIVAGVGAMGSATLQQLTARGARVLGIERFGIAHAHGSSGGDTRLIRKAYFEHPDYVPLLARAYENWRALEAASGARLLFETGALYMGRPDGALLDGSRRSAALHGLRLETLTAAALRERFPQFRCPEGHAALFEPEAGFLLASHAIRASLAVAQASGARLITGERLLDWGASADGVWVRTNRDRYQAGRLVLTLGSWSAGLLRGLGFDLRVTRQPLYWVAAPEPAGYGLGALPAWALEDEGGPGLYYGFPALPAAHGVRPGIKFARHLPGPVVDPDAPMQPADRLAFQQALARVQRFLPALQGPWCGADVCKYTLSADEHFIVDLHPALRRVSFACGFSGHGFKFASVMGEALADLALEGRSALPIEFLSMAGRALAP